MGFLLTPYVVSSFEEHSLTATIGVAANIIGGVSKLPLAKILDVWGRPQGYLLTMCLMVIGLILMAACNNVNTYAAAQIFYWVGYGHLLIAHLSQRGKIATTNMVTFLAIMESPTPPLSSSPTPPR